MLAYYWLGGFLQKLMAVAGEFYFGWPQILSSQWCFVGCYIWQLHLAQLESLLQHCEFFTFYIRINQLFWSPPGSSVRGISQVRILVWVAISFSRGSSQHRDWTHVNCLAGGFFATEPPGKTLWGYGSWLNQTLSLLTILCFFLYILVVEDLFLSIPVFLTNSGSVKSYNFWCAHGRWSGSSYSTIWPSPQELTFSKA